MSEELPGVPMAMPAEIAAGIVQVQGSIKKLAKTSENKYQRYDYVSIDDFLEAIGPLEAEAGIFILSDEDDTETVEMPSKDKESGSHWLRVRWLFWIGHKSGALYGPLRRTVSVPAVGAQAYGSAQSYALKQFCRGLYKIPTGDTDDPDKNDHGQMPTGGGRRQPREQWGNGNGGKPQGQPPKTEAPPKSTPPAKKEWTENEKVEFLCRQIENASAIADPVQAQAALAKAAKLAGEKSQGFSQEGLDKIAAAMEAADQEIRGASGS